MVFITHLHADHTTGLPGLLNTLKISGKKDVIKIIGPIGIRNFVREIFECFIMEPIPYEIEVHEIDLMDNTPFKTVVETENFSIVAFRTNHDVPSLGYAFLEKHQYRFDASRANKLGIPYSPIRQKLIRGERVILPDGRIIKPEDVLYKVSSGRKIVYTGDTKPIKDKDILNIFKKADMLIHDATFIRKYHASVAEQRFHSTIEDAIEVAIETNVKRLALFHISARYTEEELIQQVIRDTVVKLCKENKKECPEVIVPNDDFNLIL